MEPDAVIYCEIPRIADYAMLRSDAFMSIKSVTAIRVLMLFLYKCRWQYVIDDVSHKTYYVLRNQGQIRLTYSDAFRQIGIAKSQFYKAVKTLIYHGFIEIAKHGYGSGNLYSLSEMWKDCQWRSIAVPRYERY